MINIELENYYNKSERNILRLSACNEISAYKVDYPITFEGFINNERVKVKLLSSISSIKENYEFVIFPSEFEIFKEQVIKAIDEKLHFILD